MPLVYVWMQRSLMYVVVGSTRVVRSRMIGHGRHFTAAAPGGVVVVFG